MYTLCHLNKNKLLKLRKKTIREAHVHWFVNGMLDSLKDLEEKIKNMGNSPFFKNSSINRLNHHIAVRKVPLTNEEERMREYYDPSTHHPPFTIKQDI